MIIFLKLITQNAEHILSRENTWDEYRLMIGDGYSPYSQARARAFSDLGDEGIADIIDYIDKIQSSKNNYTLNLFSTSIIGSAILAYLCEIFGFSRTRSSGFSSDSNDELLSRFIRIRDEIVRAGISF